MKTGHHTRSSAAGDTGEFQHSSSPSGFGAIWGKGHQWRSSPRRKITALFLSPEVFQTCASYSCLGDNRNGGNKADFALVKRRCCQTPRRLSESSKESLLNLINNHKTKQAEFTKFVSRRNPSAQQLLLLRFSCPFKFSCQCACYLFDVCPSSTFTELNLWLFLSSESACSLPC